MKKKLALLLLFLFLLYSSNISLIAFESEGQKLLLEGKKHFNNGKFDKAIEILNKALSFDLSDKEKIEAHLYIGICWIALNSVPEGERHFKEIIKINPEYIFEKEEFPPEIKNIFDKTKYQFPIIYEFFSLPEIFHPYANDVPYFKFKITAPDCLNLSATRNNQIVFKDRKCFESSGQQIYQWGWRDELVKMNKINFTLLPDKNKNEYYFERKVKLEVEMPKELLFKNNTFQIEGREFLPETKIKKSYPDLLLWSGIAALFGVGAYASFTYNPEKNTYLNEKKYSKVTYITLGVISVALSLFSLKVAFTPKKKEVSIEENIEKNNKLKKEIQPLKEKIKVKQVVENG